MFKLYLFFTIYLTVDDESLTDPHTVVGDCFNSRDLHFHRSPTLQKYFACNREELTGYFLGKLFSFKEETSYL